MKITPVKTPLVAKKMFPNYVWDMSSESKDIYLTFDDGPTPEITDWTLETLKTHNAKATFFCIGANIDKHPELYKKIVYHGHTIGNHTQHHVKGWKTKTKVYIDDVLEAEKRIGSHNPNQDNLLFRPPYGQIKPKQGRRLMALDYKIIMWDVLSFDWDKDVSEEDCLKNVISNTKAGSIIVFHDSIKASKNMMYTLPRILEHFKDYTFKSL